MKFITQITMVLTSEARNVLFAIMLAKLSNGCSKNLNDVATTPLKSVNPITAVNTVGYSIKIKKMMMNGKLNR
ncbi:hypothetical protein SDC9_159730 [bioreactor metagenome]|uniref:Uncharacterized protein n=1 Tax=bioreactor metagenome TaxID=1076179 RepID=A0A645FFZ7_9ZZZZ